VLLAKKSSTALGCVGAILLGYAGLVYALLHPQLPDPISPLLLYSNQNHQDLKRTFAHAISKAKHSIHVNTYAVSDPDIIQLLQKKADSGISTTILYDGSASPPLQQMMHGLAQATPVKTKGLMHRKIVIIDQTQVFLGSANMTTQSLKMHDNLVIGAYHPEAAKYLEHPTTPYFCFNIEQQQAALWLLPDVTGEALKGLVQRIKQAKKTIRVAMFTLTHPDLTEALIDAARRGVVVKCAVDYYTGHGASLKAVQRLQEAGINLYLSRGQQLLHHKWVEIDRTTLVSGSANWTAAAFARNQDCFMILEPLNTKQKKFMKSLWKTIKKDSEKWTP
jgi:phosphatidylserine/phosphatidylglycerophosphate/cardiolipin synthase-like enzyme